MKLSLSLSWLHQWGSPLLPWGVGCPTSFLYPPSTIKSSLLCLLVDPKSWKCLNCLYINMTCKCAFVLGPTVCLIIFPSSISDSKESIFSVEVNGFTFIFHQLFKVMAYFSLQFCFSSFNCLFVLHYLTFLWPSFPPKHLSYFLFYKLPFILGPSIPPLQSIPGCLQVCYTFRNWKSPFTTLLVWFYSFKIPCLFLCLHRHFSGIGPQVTPKNRWQACKLWIFGYLCLYCVLPLNE